MAFTIGLVVGLVVGAATDGELLMVAAIYDARDGDAKLLLTQEPLPKAL